MACGNFASQETFNKASNSTVIVLFVGIADLVLVDVVFVLREGFPKVDSLAYTLEERLSKPCLLQLPAAFLAVPDALNCKHSRFDGPFVRCLLCHSRLAHSTVQLGNLKSSARAADQRK